MNVDLASAGQYDQIALFNGVTAGAMEVDGGTLNVMLLNGYVPAPGTSFDVITGFTSHSGSGFDAITDASNQGIQYSGSFVGSGTYRITVAGIPEPGMLGLLAMAGSSSLMLRRRRRI